MCVLYLYLGVFLFVSTSRFFLSFFEHGLRKEGGENEGGRLFSLTWEYLATQKSGEDGMQACDDSESPDGQPRGPLKVAAQRNEAKRTTAKE